jgi:hypothetical protein
MQKKSAEENSNPNVTAPNMAQLFATWLSVFG